MNIAQYMERISFRHLQPHVMKPAYYKRWEKALRWLGTSPELFNTVLPENHKLMQRKLRKLCAIPKMSTFAIGAIINQCVAQMSDAEAFVNVGVWQGFTLLCGMAGNPGKRCVGVDNFSEFSGPRDTFLRRFHRSRSAQHHFYEMDYERYFMDVHRGPIGFYIYDGDHTHEHQLKGLRLAEPFFSKNCIVLVDDTNAEEPRRGTFDFLKMSSYEYQMLLDVTTAGNGHPTFWNGVIIFQRTM
jgi:hypothetical protein